MTQRRLNLSLIFCCLALTFIVVKGGTIAELYFSNNADIMRLMNGSTSVVITDLTLVESIDCNICDRLIYWVDRPSDGPEAIRRADPNDRSTNETVIDRGLQEVHGLALDWVGNNIYFSQGAGPNGRIEVATCDGRYRRVLASDLTDIGAITINVHTGYLYYIAENSLIKSMMLNGTLVNEAVVDDTREIVGLKVDPANNRLYWTNKDHPGIKYFDLSSNPNPVSDPPEVATGNSLPYQLVIHRDRLYWTQQRVVNMEDSTNVQTRGGLYTTTMDSDLAERLLESDTLSPQDLCYFSDTSMPPSSCADMNGGCDRLCITVPSVGGGTEAQCACPTGIAPTDSGTCPRFPDNFLLYTWEHSLPIENSPTYTDVRMISLDLAPPFIDTPTAVSIPQASAKFIAYDITRHQVYWSQLEPPLIRRTSLDGLDGKEVETIIDTSISVPESLAVDPYSMNLYWVDSKLDKIEVYGLMNGYRKVLVRTSKKPQGLALDLKNRYMYWTDLDRSNPHVRQCRLDGTQCIDLEPYMDPSLVMVPATITVDPLTGGVYWAETPPDGDHILMYNYSSRTFQRHTISGARIINHPDDIIGLAVHGEYLYWTDRGGTTTPPLGRANKRDLTMATGVLSTSVGGVHSILATNQSAESITSGCGQQCDQLCLPSASPDTPTCACADHLISVGGSCTEPPAVLVVSTSAGVYRFVRVGSSWGGGRTKLFNEVPAKVDADSNSNTLYWINSTDQLIYRSPLDEIAPQAVVRCCVGVTSDLAVDWYGQNLYWTDSSRRVIEVAKLDGDHRIVLYRVPEKLGEPHLLTLDPLRGHLYWSPTTGARIYRWRMDGGTVTHTTTVFWESPSHTEVFGMAINYTTDVGVSHQLYFGANSQSGAAVYSVDVDGADSTASSIGPGLNSNYEALASYQGDFYIIKENDWNIQDIRHDDPQNVNPSLVNLFDVYLQNNNSLNVSDLVILHHTNQPGVHECGVNNNECGDRAVCLVESGVRGRCVCSSLDAQRLEGTDDHVTCSDTSAFLLIATNNSIYNLPFVDSSHSARSSSTPQPLPLGVVNSITTLAYDPVTKSVLYTDGTSQLHSAKLDSSAEETYPLPSLNPSSLAFDWRGGHVFSTQMPGFQIELTTVTGKGRGSVLGSTVFDKHNAYKVLGDVAFDSLTSTLYWTFLYGGQEPQFKGLGAELHYMSLLRQDEQHTIDLNGRKIRGLIAEPDADSLFWIDESSSSTGSRIERFNIASATIDTLVPSVANVEALTSVVVDGSPLLFWFDRGAGGIYVHSTNETKLYMEWSPPDGVGVVGMVGGSTLPLSVSTPCRSSQLCSHYCLPGDTPTPQCHCPPDSRLSGTECIVDCDSPSLRSCGGMYNECYPRTYWCDHIPHCISGADELDTTCGCSQDDFGCYESGPRECVPSWARCDGHADCPMEEDERDCCEEADEFGCYVSVDTGYLLGGGPDRLYRCLNNMTFFCNGQPDCLNSTVDEPESCPMTMAPPSTTTAPVSDSIKLPIIIVFVILCVAAMVIIVSLICYTCHRHYKKRVDQHASIEMTRAYNHQLNSGVYKIRDSPPMSVSDYCSELSGGTHSTHIGNGSHVSMYKRRSADPSNPPPSPNTLRRSNGALTDIEDCESVFSEPISEYPVPPVPAPSLNYDMDMGSDNLSFSVSQSQFPISGRANPLLQQQRSLYAAAYHHNGGYPSMQGGGHGHHWPKMMQHSTNGTNPYTTNNCHHYPTSHPRKELDSLARTETESTVSMTTVSTENREDEYYGEQMSYTPPGRPPSPVTLVSEYPPPMSPDSTLSGFSEDECSEQHLHHT